MSPPSPPGFTPMVTVWWITFYNQCDDHYLFTLSVCVCVCVCVCVNKSTLACYLFNLQ